MKTRFQPRCETLEDRELPGALAVHVSREMLRIKRTIAREQTFIAREQSFLAQQFVYLTQEAAAHGWPLP